MKFKYGAKYIFPIILITCTSLVLINFALKDNKNKTIEHKASRIIIEFPKKEDVPKGKNPVNDEGTRVSVPSTNGKAEFPVQPLPVPDSNAPIVFTLL